MKKFLLFLSIIISVTYNAQSLVLTQAANEPVIGDTNRTHILDTTAFSSGLPNSVSGSSAVWNFQALNTTTALITSAYVSTTAVSSSSNYAGSNIVQVQGGLNTFYKSVSSPTTQTEFMGISSSSLTMNFTNTAIMAKYPVSFGSTITDNFSGSFTFSISGNANGNVTTTADGTGTLNLCDGITLTNVLRVKSVQNVTLTSGFFPVGTMKQTIYNYYHASEKYPILNISYTSVALTGQTATVTGAVSGNNNVFVVGIRENSLSDSQISTYPNPTSDILHINLTSSLKPSEIIIYTQLGQIAQRNGYSNEINISNLSPGIYFIEVKTNSGTARKKFIKNN